MRVVKTDFDYHMSVVWIKTSIWTYIMTFIYLFPFVKSLFVQLLRLIAQINTKFNLIVFPPFLHPTCAAYPMQIRGKNKG